MKQNFSITLGKYAAALLVVVSIIAPMAPIFAGSGRLGDLNFDGTVTASDALIAEQYANGKLTLSVEQRFVGDVDQDNRVGRGDALIILKHAVGIIPALPVMFGDVNDSGSVTSLDALTIQKAIEEGMSLSDVQRTLADVDLDGVLTLTDVELVLERAVGNVASLPTYKPEISGATWVQEDWSGKLSGGALHGYTSANGFRVTSGGDIALSFTMPAGRTVGDINDDGHITTTDAEMLDEVLAGGETFDFAERFSADVDGDERITRADKVVFEAYFAGVVTTLPVQFGDLNKDKAVTVAESQKILEMAVGTYTGDAYERFVADTTVNGSILASDAQAALRYAEGELECLPFLIELQNVPCADSNPIATGTLVSAVFNATRPVEWITASTTVAMSTSSPAKVELYVRASNDPSNLGAYTKVVDGALEHIGQYAQYKVVITGNKDVVLSRVALRADYALESVRDLAPDCSVRGLYGTYYNFPSTHPDMQNGLPYNVYEADPFDRDWYELDKYFAFSRTDALTSLNVPTGFFPVNEGLAGDPQHFAARFSGTINAAATSSYPFAMSSDDDSWMVIDNEVVINLSGIHPLKTGTTSVTLTPGLHAIDIFFAERQTTQSGFVVSIPDNLGVSPCVAEPVFENHAPEITGPNEVTVRVGNTAQFTIVASDPDGDDLTFTNTLPAGAQFNVNTGVFTWAPTTAGVFTATFSVSDGEASASHTTTITVLDPIVNHAPEVDAPARIEKFLGESVTFTVTATDPDGDTLTATSSIPAGAVFNATTGAFAWTPSAIGTYTASFTYSDGRLSTTKVTTIVITQHVIVNHPPVITAPAEVVGNAGEIIHFKVTTSDSDNDHVTLTANGVPMSAVFDADLGVFNWIPTTTGTTTLTWSATDGKATTTASTIVVVRDALQCVENVYARVIFTKAENIGTGNLLPRVYVGSATNALPSGAWFPLYQNGVAITDSALEAYADVQGFAIERQNGNFRVLLHGSHEGGEEIGYPNREDAEGSIEIMKGTVLGRTSDESHKLEAVDNVIVAGGGLTFDMQVSIDGDGFLVDVSQVVDCTPENQAPVWSGPTTLSGKVNDVFTATIRATDADGDLLTYTLELPNGATYSTSTGAFSFSSSAAGTFIAKFYVTDGKVSSPVLHTLTLTISSNGGGGGGGGGGPTPTTGGGGGGGNSTPPTLQIYDIRVTDITNTTAVVRWKTNFLGSSRVIYDPVCGKYNASLSPNFGYGRSSLELPATVMTNGAQEHTVALSGLTRASLYCFRVIATGQGQVISGEGNFTTTGGVVPPAPVVVPPTVIVPAPVVPTPAAPVAVPPAVEAPEAPAPQTAAVSQVFPLPWWIWLLFFETVLVAILALRERDERSRTTHVLSALLIPVGFIDWLGMTRATFVTDVLGLPWYIIGTLYLLACAILGWTIWEERMMLKSYGKRTRNAVVAVSTIIWAAVMIWAFGWGLAQGRVRGIDLFVSVFVALGTIFWVWYFGRENKSGEVIAVGNDATLNFYTPKDDVSRITV